MHVKRYLVNLRMPLKLNLTQQHHHRPPYIQFIDGSDCTFCTIQKCWKRRTKMYTYTLYVDKHTVKKDRTKFFVKYVFPFLIIPP